MSAVAHSDNCPPFDRVFISEKKERGTTSRQEYLDAISQAIRARNGEKVRV
jgi:hypothetical protein